MSLYDLRNVLLPAEASLFPRQNATVVSEKIDSGPDSKLRIGNGLGIVVAVVISSLFMLWMIICTRRFVRLRRTDRPLKACFLIALSTKVRVDNLAPMRSETRYWRDHEKSLARLGRLLPSKLRPSGSPSRSAPGPFAVNLERRYRVSARSLPTRSMYGPHPPDRVYLHHHSATDLPSYVDANRNVPPLYVGDLEAQGRVVYVEHSLVS